MFSSKYPPQFHNTLFQFSVLSFSVPKWCHYLYGVFPKGGPFQLQVLRVRASAPLLFSSALSALGSCSPGGGLCLSTDSLSSEPESPFSNLTIHPLSGYSKDWEDRLQIFSFGLASDHNVQIGFNIGKLPRQSISSYSSSVSVQLVTHCVLCLA